MCIFCDINLRSYEYNRIVYLQVYNCDKIDSISYFPSDMINLNIVKCPRLKSLPPLPASTETVSIHECPLLTDLGDIPSKVESICCFNSKLKNIKFSPNNSIRELRCGKSPLLEDISAQNLHKLEYLDCADCPNLSSLPDLSSSLIYLNISGTKIDPELYSKKFPRNKDNFIHENRKVYVPSLSE